MSQIVWVGSSSRFTAYSGPVQDYIDRVIAADVAAGNTQGLELATRNAFDVFITGCISDGTLGTSGGVLSQANSLIKAACPMAGARTLSGALIPIVGTAPTNFNFVAADYSRKTGLKGDASTKYLHSNRFIADDPLNNRHIAVYVTEAGGSTYIGGGDLAGTVFIQSAGSMIYRLSNGGTYANGSILATGYIGASRSSETEFISRCSGINVTHAVASTSLSTSSIGIFARITNPTTIIQYSNARLSFYSIGQSIVNSALDSRITTLMAALAAAIP